MKAKAEPDFSQSQGQRRAAFPRATGGIGFGILSRTRVNRFALLACAQVVSALDAEHGSGPQCFAATRTLLIRGQKRDWRCDENRVVGSRLDR